MEFVKTLEFNSHKLATAHLDGGGKDIVIFCHGFRSSSIGPNRLFVVLSRLFAKQGISSFRFDQFGSGNSEGDFLDSSFNDWIATTKSIVSHYLKKGYRVALLGQSMGGAMVLAVGSEIQDLSSIVAWVPDPNIELFEPPASGFLEEGGQRVGGIYWQEAYDARVAEKLPRVQAPTYIVQCSNDEYVSSGNHQAILENAQPHHKVEMLSGYTHSSWTYDQAQEVVEKSVNFITSNFGGRSK